MTKRWRDGKRGRRSVIGGWETTFRKTITDFRRIESVVPIPVRVPHASIIISNDAAGVSFERNKTTSAKNRAHDASLRTIFRYASFCFDWPSDHRYLARSRADSFVPQPTDH